MAQNKCVMLPSQQDWVDCLVNSPHRSTRIRTTTSVRLSQDLSWLQSISHSTLIIHSWALSQSISRLLSPVTSLVSPHVSFNPYLRNLPSSNYYQCCTSMLFVLRSPKCLILSFRSPVDLEPPSQPTWLRQVSSTNYFSTISSFS